MKLIQHKERLLGDGSRPLCHIILSCDPPFQLRISDSRTDRIRVRIFMSYHIYLSVFLII